MGALSFLGIQDGEATPVTRWFYKARVDGNRSVYEDRAGGVYIGYGKIVFDLTRPSGPIIDGQNRNLKCHVRLELPFLKEASTGGTAAGYTAAPSVDYRLVAECKFTLPERSVEQDRKNLLTLFIALLSINEMADSVERFDLPH